jgi:hypothetical protein
MPILYRPAQPLETVNTEKVFRKLTGSVAAMAECQRPGLNARVARVVGM